MNTKFLFLILGCVIAASWGFYQKNTPNKALTNKTNYTYSGENTKVSKNINSKQAIKTSRSRQTSGDVVGVARGNKNLGFYNRDGNKLSENNTLEQVGSDRENSKNNKVANIVTDPKDNPYKQFMKAAGRKSSLNSTLKNLSSQGLREDQLIKKNEYFEKLSQQLKELQGKDSIIENKKKITDRNEQNRNSALAEQAENVRPLGADDIDNQELLSEADLTEDDLELLEQDELERQQVN